MQTTSLVALALILSTAIVALVNVPRIQAWEKANGYPFGRMCHSIFTGYADTCR